MEELLLNPREIKVLPTNHALAHLSLDYLTHLFQLGNKKDIDPVAIFRIDGGLYVKDGNRRLTLAHYYNGAIPSLILSEGEKIILSGNFTWACHDYNGTNKDMVLEFREKAMKVGLFTFDDVYQKRIRNGLRP